MKIVTFLLLALVPLTACLKTKKLSKTQSLGEVRQDGNGGLLSSVMFMNKVSGIDQILYRRCASFKLPELSAQDKQDFERVSYLDTECNRSKSAPQKIDTERKMELVEFESQLTAAIKAANYEPNRAAGKAKEIVGVIRSQEMLEDAFSFSLARLPFDGRTALELERRSCVQPCIGDKCWQCTATNRSGNLAKAECFGENDARLVALNSCEGPGCDVVCDNRSLNIASSILPSSPAIAVSQSNQPATQPAVLGCDPSTNSQCYSCRCWGGGLDLGDPKLFTGTSAVRSNLACTQNLYCERAYSQTTVHHVALASVNEQQGTIKRVQASLVNPPTNAKQGLGLQENGGGFWSTLFGPSQQQIQQNDRQTASDQRWNDLDRFRAIDNRQQVAQRRLMYDLSGSTQGTGKEYANQDGLTFGTPGTQYVNYTFPSGRLGVASFQTSEPNQELTPEQYSKLPSFETDAPIYVGSNTDVADKAAIEERQGQGFANQYVSPSTYGGGGGE